MINKIISKRGPTIFRKLITAFIISGFIVIIALQVNNYFSLQRLITKELKSRFSNSSKDAAEYFDTAYTVSIDRNLKFIERSDALNNLLSSQKNEILLTYPQAERLFLFFTNRDKGTYLSLRFIDARGVEKIVTEGNKRIKNYVSLDATPKDVLYERLSALFYKLKSEKPDVILCEGPFRYQGKYTFLVGIVKSDPEIGKPAGVVVFHCDLTDYFNYLAEYKFYGERAVKIVFLDNTVIFPSAENDTIEQKQKDFYILSKEIRLGSDNQRLFNVVFGISPKIFQIEAKKILIHSLLFMLIAMLIFGSMAFIVSKQFSRPLINLADSAKRFGQGDLSIRVNIKATGEIQMLIETFNRMAARFFSDSDLK